MKAIGEEMRPLLEMLQERVQKIKEAGLLSSGTNQEDSKVYECAKCKDERGFIQRDEDGEERWHFCECHHRLKIKQLFKSSEITDEFQRLRFSNFVIEGRPEIIKQAYDTAREYVMHFRENRTKRQNSICLTGTPGTGKTHLLIAIANKCIENGVPVHYFPWVEGFNELKDDLNKLNEKVPRMQTVDVLFIDDLYKGGEIPTTFELKQLYAIVNHRYLNHLPMLISSERHLDELLELDDALASRIFEMCEGYYIQINEPRSANYRLRNMFNRTGTM